MSKSFGRHGFFSGVVVGYDRDRELYRVEYEDGDEGYCDFPEEGIEIMPAKDGQVVEVKDELPALRSKKAKTGMFDRVKIMLISANDS